MNTIQRMLGDVHGKYGRLKKILKKSPYPIIQVGDMGVGFFKQDRITYDIKPDLNPPHYLMKKTGSRGIRGNHDNPSVISRQSYWIEDGTVETIGRHKLMYVGGAASTDIHLRIEGLSWWKDEELSLGRLNEIVDIYLHEKPSVMVTHDCPDEIAHILFGGTSRAMMDNRTRQAFQSMFEHHQPTLWYFGHWHKSVAYNHNGTRFRCLAELEYEDVDLG